MKLIPLTQFICDRCGELISKPEDGWIEFKTNPDTLGTSAIRIVHHHPASPVSVGTCYGPPELAGGPLERHVGPDAIARLMFFLDYPIEDRKNFKDFVARVSIPHYEEARMYRSAAEADGFFEHADGVWPFLQSTLLEIIETYGDTDESD